MCDTNKYSRTGAWTDIWFFGTRTRSSADIWHTRVLLVFFATDRRVFSTTLLWAIYRTDRSRINHIFPVTNRAHFESLVSKKSTSVGSSWHSSKCNTCKCPVSAMAVVMAPPTIMVTVNLRPLRPSKAGSSDNDVDLDNAIACPPTRLRSCRLRLPLCPLTIVSEFREYNSLISSRRFSPHGGSLGTTVLPKTLRFS